MAPKIDLRAALATVAPGTELREGLERILRGRTGALIVIGHDKLVDFISSGGFELDVPFTATGLRELAKMDGAIIVDAGITRILRAGVHLMPDPSIQTEETGTRHRTADRVARQTGLPVVSVSASMHIIALYLDDHRHVLEEAGAVIGRANQAIATLERYRHRLDEVTDALSALEIEDLVTVRDVAAVAQRLEMVSRIAREIDTYVLELGTDGRLLALQLEELIGGVDTDRELLVRDYMPGGRRRRPVEAVLADLAAIDSSSLVELGSVAQAMRIGTDTSLDAPLAPRGYRCCRASPGSRPPSWSGSSSTSVPCRSCSVPRSTISRPSRASASCVPRGVREGLSRLAESSILERYV